MNNYEKYLSIGTVVRLKEGTKNIMITGFCPINGADNKMYDYCACLYPEGMLTSEANLLFNHDQIAEVLYNGFQNEEEVKFKNILNQLINEKMRSGEFPENSSANVSVPLNFAPINQTVQPQQVQPQMFTNNGQQ